ncbi:MAG: hypothetical protein JRG76_15035 [Deltaproteobacteria bacterium]|nr:hypothetical protein [Deltaproteobacteria bacterium]MBW2415817.1 hypothetical protein [Deltaproteobacteria bacterium]
MSRDSTIDQVATVVCAALARHGIRAALSGGAVVSIYSRNAYESDDLDFIVQGFARKVDPAMEEIGFRREAGRRYWTHPDTHYWVEFPQGPLRVGDEVVDEVAELRSALGVLRLLPPTECVMDRLAAYYHWNDAQGLEQAVLVASRHPVHMARIEQWSRREGAEGRFRDFVDQLESARSG